MTEVESGSRGEEARQGEMSHGGGGGRKRR